MLTKSERLKGKYLFDLVFKQGKANKQRVSSKYVLLYFLYKKNNKFNTPSLPKAAFIVGLKVDKKAVKRNLYKRRMREAYKILREKLIKKETNNLFALVWVANPEIKDASFIELKNIMENSLRKIIQ